MPSWRVASGDRGGIYGAGRREGLGLKLGSALRALSSVSREEPKCFGAKPDGRWGTPSLGGGNKDRWPSCQLARPGRRPTAFGDVPGATGVQRRGGRVSHSHLVLSLRRGSTIPRPGPRIPSPGPGMWREGNWETLRSKEALWAWAPRTPVCPTPMPGGCWWRCCWAVRGGVGLGEWGLGTTPHWCRGAAGGLEGRQSPWQGCKPSLPRCPRGNARSSTASISRSDPWPPVPCCRHHAVGLLRQLRARGQPQSPWQTPLLPV